LLHRRPDVLVDKGNALEQKPFYLACDNGHSAVVKYLLNDPRINPNDSPAFLQTSPLFVACDHAFIGIIKILLTDPRIKVNEGILNQSTSLHDLLIKDRYEALWWLFTTDEIIDTRFCGPRFYYTLIDSCVFDKNGVEEGDVFTDCLYPTPRDFRRSFYYFLKRYQKDPREARWIVMTDKLRRNYFSGLLFALVVFISDDYATRRAPDASNSHRFIGICIRLPIELQMVICNRVYRSTRDVIMACYSEHGFQWLARSTLPWS
jgi:hypothetical protein